MMPHDFGHWTTWAEYDPTLGWQYHKHYTTEAELMPAKSKAQLHIMQAAEHNPQFAKKVGIPQKVAREFVSATPKGAKLPARKKSK